MFRPVVPIVLRVAQRVFGMDFARRRFVRRVPGKDEGDAVAAKVMGNNAAQNKSTIDRGAMREVLGGEIIRELILK